MSSDYFVTYVTDRSVRWRIMRGLSDISNHKDEGAICK